MRYSSTVEEKNEVRISVLQFRSIRHVVSALSTSSPEQWLWPTNHGSLLQNPSLILWFRAEDVKLNRALQSWMGLMLNSGKEYL